MNNLVIFESNMKNGPISLNKDYYPTEMGYLAMLDDYKTRLDLLAEEKGFNSNKLITTLQKGQDKKFYYQDGAYTYIDDSLALEDSLWKETFYGDMIVLDSKYKNMPIGCRVADCPCLILYDKEKGGAILAHCGSVEINRELPLLVLNTLKEIYQADDSNIYAYISSCIGKNNYIYDSFPSWATNSKVWDGCIKHEKDGYHINLRKAIYRQLRDNGVFLSHMHMNFKDTYDDPTLYSNVSYKKGNVRKKGRYLVGCYYK